MGIPGLAFKSAYVYGWEAQTAPQLNAPRAKERELFNQISYTIQEGKAKDLAFKLRTTIYRADNKFQANSDNKEVRLYVDYPLDIMAMFRK